MCLSVPMKTLFGKLIGFTTVSFVDVPMLAVEMMGLPAHRFVLP